MAILRSVEAVGGPTQPRQASEGPLDAEPNMDIKSKDN